MFKPNIDVKQRWMRGVGGAILIAAAFALPTVAASWRIALLALGALGIAQALSGI